MTMENEKIKLKIYKIISKFYKTEDQRQDLIQKYKPFTEQFYEVLGDEITQLYNAGIQFSVFFMDFSNIRPKIHVGLYQCCSKKIKVTKDTRLHLDLLIKERTPFEKVVWEI